MGEGEVASRVRDELEETRRQFHALLDSLSDTAPAPPRPKPTRPPRRPPPKPPAPPQPR